MWNRFTPLLGVTIVLGSCTPGVKYDPFSTDPEIITERGRVLALAPVSVAAELTVSDSTLVALETGIIDTLRAAGFEVIRPVAFSSIWETILDDIGGFFDPRTGEVIQHKRTEAYRRLGDELRNQFGAGAILYPEVQVVEAPFADGVARWDGTSQSVASFWDRLAETVTAAAAALAREPHESTLPYGTVAAVSLSVTIEDLDGVQMYAHWGGIEVVADEETGEWRADSEILMDSERLRRSVGIALGPLLERATVRLSSSG